MKSVLILSVFMFASICQGQEDRKNCSVDSLNDVSLCFKDVQGIPFSQQMVFLKREDGKRDSVITNENGIADFYLLQPGKYEISTKVKLDDSLTVFRKNVEIPAPEAVYFVLSSYLRHSFYFAQYTLPICAVKLDDNLTIYRKAEPSTYYLNEFLNGEENRRKTVVRENITICPPRTPFNMKVERARVLTRGDLYF